MVAGLTWTELGNFDLLLLKHTADPLALSACKSHMFGVLPVSF